MSIIRVLLSLTTTYLVLGTYWVTIVHVAYIMVTLGTVLRLLYIVTDISQRDRQSDLCYLFHDTKT